jgi:uncharacterized protein YdhG (YjbR/CyaY superfamily)
MEVKIYNTIDEYIATFPDDVQKVLQKVRQTIKKAAPQATETISYGMPTFDVNGKHLVHFAGWQSHVGFYATPSGNEAFQKEISAYENAKGSVKFPLDQPIPYDLIAKMVAFRVQEVAVKK